MSLNEKPDYKGAFNAIVSYLTTKTKGEDNDYSIKKDPLINFQQRVGEQVNRERLEKNLRRKLLWTEKGV